jgi:hypothetical protein
MSSRIFCKGLTYLMILAVLMSVTSPMASSTGLAQVGPAHIRQVRVLETGDLGLPNPAGLAFSPGAKAFYILEARRPTQPLPLGTDIIKRSPPLRSGPASHASRLLFGTRSTWLLTARPTAYSFCSLRPRN